MWHVKNNSFSNGSLQICRTVYNGSWKQTMSVAVSRAFYITMK